MKVGSSHTFTIWRGKKEKRLKIKLAALPGSDVVPNKKVVGPARPQSGEGYNSALGLSVRTPNPQERKQYPKGLVVVKLDKRSPLRRTGVRAGTFSFG